MKPRWNPSTSPRSRTARVLRAYLWRAVLEGGPVAARNAALCGILYGLGVLTAFFAPNLFTSVTRSSLERLSGTYFADLPRHGVALGLAFLLLQGPYFVALMSSYVAASTPLSVMGAELGRGAFESLLATPAGVRNLVFAVLVTCLVFAVGSWVVMTALTIGASTAIIGLIHAGIDVNSTFWQMALLLPLGLTVLSTLISLLFTMRFPSVARAKLGASSSQNPVLLLAVAPSLAALVTFSLRPTINPFRFASYLFAIAAVLSVVLVIAIPWMLTREQLIQEG